MSEVVRISPKEVRNKVQAGSALLVCAYQSDDKFNMNHLAGALSYTDFMRRINGLSKEQEIIFYCA